MRHARKLEMGRLIAFVTICEEGSISAASRRLGIAQPALTVTMTKLEQGLGVQLLIRDARGVSPTLAGKQLLGRAHELLGLAETTYRELQDGNDNPQGEVVIGFPSSTAAVITVPLVMRLADEFPGIKLRVVEGFSGYLWTWLCEGKLDIAIVFDREPVPEATCEVFAYEDLHLVGSYGLQNRKEVGLSELGRYPLVMPSRLHAIRSLLDAHAARHGAGLDVRIEIDSGQHLIRLVETGKWFSILAPAAVASQVKARQLQTAPLEPRLTRSVCIARHRGRAADSAVARVFQELKKEGKSLLDSGQWEARAAD